MKRTDKEVIDFFKEVIKVEINGGVWILNKRLERLATNHKSISALEKWDKQKYDDLVKISQMDKENRDLINRLVQDSVSTAFVYFFKRLEEGENIEMGERINFDLVAVNKNTGQRTKLISSDENEQRYNDFQDWILDNCSDVNNKDN